MIPRLRAALRRYARTVEGGRRAEVERFAETLLQTGEAFSNLLLAVLGDPTASPELRAQACGLLSVLDERRAIPTLIKIVQDRHVAVHLRGEATQALRSLPSKRAVRPLIQVLLDADDDEWVRRMAAQSLGRLDDPRARDALLRIVKDSHVPPEIRGDATEALTGFHDVRAVPTLREQLRDPSPTVRFWAVFSLGALADADVIPDLERIANEDNAVAPGWWSLRKEALDAIRSISDRAHYTRTSG